MNNFKFRRFYFFFIILSIFSLSKSYSYSKEIFIAARTQDIHSQKENNPIGDNYILGPGDSLYINFRGIEIFSKPYSIDPGGNLFLPEINQVAASGKTIQELKDYLITRYQELIIDPEININIIRHRPLNVVIKGEVKMPGLHQLNYSYAPIQGRENTNFNNLSLYDDTKSIGSSDYVVYIPRVFDALKLTQGITNYADLSNIKIIRDNNISNGGGKISTKLNLLSLLRDGDQSINIRLMDGDTIIVPRGEKMLKEQILELNKSTLTPELMTVYISGNVFLPGAMQMKQGSSLIQGLYQAGGERYFTGNVKHLRFNESGKTEKSVFNLDLNASANSKKNPILLDGDIIHVNKTLLGKTTEAVLNLSNPILSTYGIISIFEQ